MISSIKMYFQGAKVSLASRMAYRMDFFISMLLMLLTELFVPLVTVLIYGNGASIPGWTLYEMLLMQGIFLLSRGIAFPFFFGMVWQTLGTVKSGTFDMFLLKPRPLVFTVITNSFDSEDIGKLIGGVALFTIAVTNLSYAPTILQWIVFVGFFILSIIMQFAIALILAGTVIVWVGNSRIYEIYDITARFGIYPVSIFPKWIALQITVVIPVAVLGAIPAYSLLGLEIPTVLAVVLSPLAFLGFGFFFFYKMVSRHTSAGG